MRLLLITYWFPPTRAMGAVRTGKLARHLLECGHDVRVLAGPRRGDCSLPQEIPPDRVIRPLQDLPAGPVRQPATRGGARSHLRTALRAAGVESVLARNYQALASFPDPLNAWLPHALRGGRRLLEDWRPELILASAPPYTAFFAARRLARSCAAPWIAELRDPWARTPYSTDPRWRQWLDAVMEHRTLRAASAIVCVSPVDAADLRQRYAPPVTTILNGYSAEDLVAPPARDPDAPLTLVHTGALYDGRRDPSPLFAAIARLGDDGRRVAVHFYGADAAGLRPRAERHGVQDRVHVHRDIPYRQSLEAQAGADVLLLLQRTAADEAGNIPGKFFEYLGARRPILLLGCETGVVAAMIRQRQAGFVGNDPDAIAAQLRRWLGRLPQGIPSLPASVRQGLSRAEQFTAYELFLRQAVADCHAASPG